MAREAARRRRRARASPCRAPGRRRRRPRRRRRSTSRAARGRRCRGGRASPRAARSPATPIATSHLAVAPRAAERVGDRRPRGRARERARAARAREASGSRGQEDERVRRRARSTASTPAFAHTKPWCVRQISTPRSARTSSADSSRTTCTWRGSLPCSAASSRARSVGSTSRQVARRALGLRDDLVRDDERRRPARSASPARGGEQRGEVVARPDLGQARRAARPRGGSPAARRAAGRAARACARRRRCRASSAARSASRSSACRCRARATAAGDPDLGPGVARERLVARASCRGRSAGAIASGGQSSSAFVPVPWRSGTIMTARLAVRVGEQRSSTSVGSSAGQSPGTSSTRRRPARSPTARPRARPGCGRARPGRGSRCASWARASASAPCSRVTTTTASTRLERRSAVSTSVSIASASARRVPLRERVAEALLGVVEPLDRQDRERASIASALREAQRLLGDAPAGGGVGHERVGPSVVAGRPATGSSATMPSSRPP